MLRIRLRRVGKKKQPSYRIVVADSRAPRDGLYIDQVGFYNPLTDPPTVNLDTDKGVAMARQRGPALRARPAHAPQSRAAGRSGKPCGS